MTQAKRYRMPYHKLIATMQRQLEEYLDSHPMKQVEARYMLGTGGLAKRVAEWVFRP